MSNEIKDIIDEMKRIAKEKEIVQPVRYNCKHEDFREYMKSVGMKLKPVNECKFIKIDGRGVYHYMLNFNGALSEYKLAPEHAKAFKLMAMHFLNEVKDGTKKSFLSEPNLMLQMGNMLNADEASAPSPAADTEVSFFGRIKNWFKRGM